MTRDRLRCGADGEALAAAFLRARGYTIVARNFRCVAGELDIIAMPPPFASLTMGVAIGSESRSLPLDGRTIVFVEVRTRRGYAHGSAFESVTAVKQHQVARVAAVYLSRHHLHMHPVRFDVVAVEVRGWTVAVVHLVDAFRL